jgi:uncharacterized protein (TIGR04551 family)
LWCLAAIAAFAPEGLALAQGFGPRPGPGMGQQEKKGGEKEGPAEAAPDEQEGEPELPPLPAWPGQETRKLQFFQMRGYFRFRWNMHHNLNLGITGSGAPYYTPVSEDPSSSLSCAKRVSKPIPGGGDRSLEADDCPAQTLGGADIRLRIEPTINVSEKVRINAQLDLFDNLVLGSTPRGFGGAQSMSVPLSAFNDSQAAPIAGQNTTTPAILVKRAWADVDTPFGLLRFGRMPVNWGLGIMHNDGSCPQCDWGDSNDRIMFAANLANHTLGMGYDFAGSGPNSLTVKDGSTAFGGQAIDLEKLDDVHQFFWLAGKIDPEDVIKDRVDRGELVLNYGIYLLYRKQQFDYATGRGLTSPISGTSTTGSYASGFLERHAWFVIPDLWFKLQWKKLYLEFEATLVGGKLENVANEDKLDPVQVLQFGWVLRSQYKFLRDSLKIGLEIGMASGDQAEQSDGQVNRRRLNPLTYDRDGWLREFRFNYDYQVDLILFREILGGVSNAVYFKPSVQYNIIDSFGARLDMIYSMTHEPVGWPGNSRNLGVELDLDIFYRNIDEGFYASLMYGVLFPLDALDHPANIFGTTGTYDAGIAHTLQGRLIVRF